VGDGGRTALHVAADYGQTCVAEYIIGVRTQLVIRTFRLVQCGANVNVTDAHGITPLLAAIWEGHTDVVKLLIANVCLLYIHTHLCRVRRLTHARPTAVRCWIVPTSRTLNNYSRRPIAVDDFVHIIK
jgi:ankyrin repeat protein